MCDECLVCCRGIPTGQDKVPLEWLRPFNSEGARKNCRGEVNTLLYLQRGRLEEVSVKRKKGGWGKSSSRCRRGDALDECLFIEARKRGR